MSRHAVDWPKLVDTIEVVRGHYGLSSRQLADQLGFSPNTFTRMRQGFPCSADNLAAIVAWLYPTNVPDWIRKIPCPTCLDRLPSGWHCTECGAGPAPHADQEPTEMPPSSAVGATGANP